MTPFKSANQRKAVMAKLNNPLNRLGSKEFMSIAEQKIILEKEVKKGNLTKKGMQRRLSFGKGVVSVIKELDSFINKQHGQLDKTEKVDLLKFKRRLISIREE